MAWHLRDRSVGWALRDASAGITASGLTHPNAANYLLALVCLVLFYDRGAPLVGTLGAGLGDFSPAARRARSC